MRVCCKEDINNGEGIEENNSRGKFNFSIKFNVYKYFYECNISNTYNKCDIHKLIQIFLLLNNTSTKNIIHFS